MVNNTAYYFLAIMPSLLNSLKLVRAIIIVTLRYPSSCYNLCLRLFLETLLLDRVPKKIVKIPPKVSSLLTALQSFYQFWH